MATQLEQSAAADTRLQQERMALEKQLTQAQLELKDVKRSLDHETAERQRLETTLADAQHSVANVAHADAVAAAERQCAELTERHRRAVDAEERARKQNIELTGVRLSEWPCMIIYDYIYSD
jgi:chromosome segregation ATPase